MSKIELEQPETKIWKKRWFPWVLAALLALAAGVTAMAALSALDRQRGMEAELRLQRETIEAMRKEAARKEEEDRLIHEARPVITNSLVSDRLTALQELVTTEYIYTNSGKYENRNQITIIGQDIGIPFTAKRFIVAYDGRIKVGVDLSQARVEVNETARAVTVTLPKSQIVSHETFEDTLVVLDETNNVFNPISIENYNEFVSGQKADMEQKAIGRGVLTNADAEAKRIVIKVGTSTLTHRSGHINIRLMEKLVKVLSDIRNTDRELVLVSSGAIGVGMGKLGLRERPGSIPGKQAAAAVGQCELMYLYDKYFSEYNHTVGQVLLTRYSLDDPESRQNVRNTFEALLGMGAIPVVNENDTVATDEIKVGDNDTLSAIVTQIIRADALIILSDIEGLYTADPSQNAAAVLVPEVRVIDGALMRTASGAGSSRGTGGMLTKLTAGRIAMAAGADMYIVSGKDPDILYDLLEGEAVGTHFIGGGGWQ